MQVQKLLQDLKTLPEEELHNLSVICEPREGISFSMFFLYLTSIIILFYFTDENPVGEKKSLAWEFLRTWTLLPKKEQ